MRYAVITVVPKKKSVIAALRPGLCCAEIVSVFLAYTKQKFGMLGIMPYQPTSCLLDKILIKDYASLVRSQFYTQFGVFRPGFIRNTQFIKIDRHYRNITTLLHYRLDSRKI